MQWLCCGRHGRYEPDRRHGRYGRCGRNIQRRNGATEALVHLSTPAHNFDEFDQFGEFQTFCEFLESSGK